MASTVSRAAALLRTAFSFAPSPPSAALEAFATKGASSGAEKLGKAAALAGVGVTGLLGLSGVAHADTAHHPSPDYPWNQSDNGAISRGRQVFNSDCAACHGMSFVAFLDAKGVKSSAAEIVVSDEATSKIKMFECTRKPSAFVPAIVGTHPLDLPFLTKARHNGQTYVSALLTGSQAGTAVKEGLHLGSIGREGAIAMPKMITSRAQEFTSPAEAQALSRGIMGCGEDALLNEDSMLSPQEL